MHNSISDCYKACDYIYVNRVAAHRHKESDEVVVLWPFCVVITMAF